MTAKKVGIVIYGEGKNRSGFWEAWIDKAKELTCMIGYNPTHACILGTSLSDKLRTLRRSERRMREAAAAEQSVSSLAIYSLPKNYNTALDNNCWLCLTLKEGSNQKGNRYANSAYCEMNSEDCSEELLEKIRSVLLDFVEMEQLEIFTMDEDEVPFNYVVRGMGDDISRYPTLHILKKEV